MCVAASPYLDGEGEPRRELRASLARVVALVNNNAGLLLLAAQLSGRARRAPARGVGALILRFVERAEARIARDQERGIAPDDIAPRLSAQALWRWSSATSRGDRPQAAATRTSRSACSRSCGGARCTRGPAPRRRPESRPPAAALAAPRGANCITEGGWLPARPLVRRRQPISAERARFPSVVQGRCETRFERARRAEERPRRGLLPLGDAFRRAATRRRRTTQPRRTSRHRRRPDRVHAAVDVQDLAGDRARQGESRKRQASATGEGSRGSQPSGAWRSQICARPLEALDVRGRHGPQRAGGDEVGAHAARPEVAGQVAVDRLERGLGDARPVVGRPRDAGVEVEADDAGAPRRARAAAASRPPAP